MDSKFLEWLLRQVNAQQDPVTEAQINRFCLSPDGPILPNGCLSSERLPEIFWRDDSERRSNAPSGYGFDPNGIPYRLQEAPGRNRTLIRPNESMSVSAESGEWVARVAGWKKNRDMPVVHSKMMLMRRANASEAEKNRLNAERPSEIRIGTQMVHEGLGIEQVAVLADGTLMWLEWTSHDEGAFRIMRDGHVMVERTERRYTRFLTLPGSDKIFGIWKKPDGGGGIGWIEDERRRIPGEILDAVHDKDGNALLVGTLAGHKNPGAHVFYPEAIQTGDTAMHYLADYIGGYRVHHARQAGDFIQRSRHGYQRWMSYRPRGGFLPQPCFLAVSPIFQQDDQLRYYGITDRHLCLMELQDTVV